MKKIILISFIIALSINAFAQDVDGMRVDQKMTYAQVVAKFGKPDLYHKVNDEFGISEDYVYGNNNRLHFEETGKFKNFVITESRFAVLTLDIDGGIRVGDPLSKLDNFKYGKPQYVRTDEDGGEIYLLYPKCDDNVYLVVRDSIIVTIFYYYPV